MQGLGFHSLANKTHFHFKGFAVDFALKQRQNATGKWSSLCSQKKRRTSRCDRQFPNYFCDDKVALVHVYEKMEVRYLNV